MVDKEVKIIEDRKGLHLPPALVIGAGPSGFLAASALRSIGVSVVLVREGANTPVMRRTAPGIDALRYLRNLEAEFEEGEGVELVGTLRVQRVDNGFLVRGLGAGPQRFGCIVLAPSMSGTPVPSGLPSEVEALAENFQPTSSEVVAFLLDYGLPSNQAAGMAAIAAAAELRNAGGTSFVLMRNAPVRHLFGETLYEGAKRAGVLFFRFDDDLPLVEVVPVSSPDEPKFRITVPDLVDAGQLTVLKCHRVIVPPGPTPSSVPSYAVDITAGDVDAEGFILSSSTHCHSGRSFAEGIFAVGEITGNIDLVDVAAQASAVAARARAWLMNLPDSAAKGAKVIVSDECCRCLTCFRVCPHAAISYEGASARSAIQASPAACHECGVCVSECPRTALALASFPDHAISSFLGEVAKMADRAPLVIYGCQRSAARAVSQVPLPEGVLFFSVPCAGWVSESLLWATLASGAAGLLVAGCHHGNCASKDGTDWAAARVKNALSALDMGNFPIRYTTVAATEGPRFQKVIQEFCTQAHNPADEEILTA